MELLVVVLIIGILASVALPQYRVAVKKVRLQKALTVFANIQKGIDMWLLNNGYPSATVRLVGCSNTSNGKCNMLDIDVEHPLICSSAWKACYDENYNYSFQAFCASTHCEINIYRLVNKSPGHIADGMSAFRRREDEDWYKEYDPQEPALNKMLELQGWRECC